MSRAYGRENKNHIKRGGNNDSEIAWTSEKNPKKTPDILGGFLFSYGSVWLSKKSNKELSG